jgi:regulation of enolase protein 1 (concanavalin A-like superfamily)
MTERVRLATIPVELRWEVPPVRWDSDGDATLGVTAGPRTDLFVDPQGTGDAALNAPRLLGALDGDFQLHALVRVGFSATYDAGVLLVWAHDRSWAKLCFEYSPQGRPMIVSVVTRGVSDDANAFEVDGDQVWLRVARLGPAFAFHASTDGSTWRFVRYFALDGDPGAAPPLVGFEAQSPAGDGCAVTFERVGFTPERLADLRDGG